MSNEGKISFRITVDESLIQDLLAIAAECHIASYSSPEDSNSFILRDLSDVQFADLKRKLIYEDINYQITQL